MIPYLYIHLCLPQLNQQTEGNNIYTVDAQNIQDPAQKKSELYLNKFPRKSCFSLNVADRRTDMWANGNTDGHTSVIIEQLR